MQSARWNVRPTRTGIRQASTPTSYDTGLSYYTTGKVQSAHIKKNVLRAVVVDGSKYNVEIKDAGSEGLVGDCSCSYNSLHHGICRHVVATLLHLMDHVDDMLIEEDTKESTIKYMIGKIPTPESLDFFADVMTNNEDILQQFITKFGLENVRLQRDYYAEIGRMYHDAAEADGKVYSNLDFEGYFINARGSQHNGEFDSATKMFREMSEIISERMIMVDDSDGYYTDCFIESIENMTESIMREMLQPQKKRQHIAYLLARFVAENRPKFVPQYRRALETICTQQEDLEHWQDLLAPHIDKLDDLKNSKKTVDLILMQVHILVGLNNADALVPFLAKFYHLDKKLCTAYLDAIRHTSPDKAQSIAQDIVERYKGDTEIMERAFEFYTPSSRGYAPLLKQMFMATGDWKYFFLLKDVSKNWSLTVNSIVKEYIKKSDPQKAIEVFIREDRISDATKLLMSLNDIDLFEAFRTRLARRYPSRYFEAYGAKIAEEAGSKSGKKHYARIQQHLISLKTVPSSEAKYAGVLDAIRRKNPKKHTLLSVIDNV